MHTLFAQLFHDLVSSEDKPLKTYVSFYHEVFNKPEHKQVLNDVNTWLEAQLDARQQFWLPFSLLAANAAGRFGRFFSQAEDF